MRFNCTNKVYAHMQNGEAQVNGMINHVFEIFCSISRTCINTREHMKIRRLMITDVYIYLYLMSHHNCSEHISESMIK